MTVEKQHPSHSTRSAFIWTRLLNVPFWVLLNLLPIILYKDLNITPWMITAMIVLKPASALFASYWGSLVHERSDRLVTNLVSANVLRYLPFLFMPWIESPWVIIAAFGFYMMMSRGVIPAWMEIFKLNFEKDTRSRVFAYGSALDYFATAVLPIGMGIILDDYTLSWRLLFPISAVLGLASTLFLLKLPKKDLVPENTPFKETGFSFLEQIKKPWAQALQLLRNRPDFAKFQWGFMIGGAGIMVMQPVIPIFFVDTLNLSYTKMLLAMAVCKAVGFAMASPLWIRLFQRWNIYSFSAAVIALAALFPFLLIAAKINSLLVYGAYILYGMFQAGSELSWHMSGPYFAHDKDSSLYSMTNVLSVGVRGCVAPLIGSLLFTLTGSVPALIAGSILCLFSAQQFLTTRITQPTTP